MSIKKYIMLLIVSLPLFAGVKNLSLDQAIQILKKDNLELKISRFNEQMKSYEVKAVEGLNYGKLDLTMMGMRSNDAGNVFGFKLQSREATFGDFGFSEFDMSGTTDPLLIAPKSLNYPDARNHFLLGHYYLYNYKSIYKYNFSLIIKAVNTNTYKSIIL